MTYAGAPIYYFAKDTKAGDVTGQGVGGVWFVAAVAGGPGGATASGAPASAAAGGGTPAKIIDFGFDPASVSVKVGGSVTWTNTGATAHTVTADDGSFDSKSLAAGGNLLADVCKGRHVCLPLRDPSRDEGDGDRFVILDSRLVRRHHLLMRNVNEPA